MSILRLGIALTVVIGLLGGCAKAPQQRLEISTAPHPYNDISTMQLGQGDAGMPDRLFANGPLDGRTLLVGSEGEIVLHPGEVILTFDDGPRPGKTDAILQTLDAFDVGATFMMLGRAAERHPDMVRAVAVAGHTIGTHTYDHDNLANLTSADAMAEIAAGEAAIRQALAPIGQGPSPFFRFPYLSQTGFLRTSLLQSDTIVLDVDIDSKDYHRDSADAVLARTLDRLEARGSGIVLFHDIHERTVALLPDFLRALEQRGYSVVRLRARDRGFFGQELFTAQVEE